MKYYEAHKKEFVAKKTRNRGSAGDEIRGTDVSKKADLPGNLKEKKPKDLLRRIKERRKDFADTGQAFSERQALPARAVPWGRTKRRRGAAKQTGRAGVRDGRRDQADRR